MSRDYPDWINVEKAAQARRVFHGRIPVVQLARLDGLIIENQDDEIDFEVAFVEDQQGQTLATIDLSGTLTLQCQRTLKPFRQEIESHSRVAIVASEHDEAALPGDYEARICPEQRLELLDLIAEDVLLALPLVPVDPASDPMPALPESRDTHRPFEALAELSKSSKQNQS